MNQDKKKTTKPARKHRRLITTTAALILAGTLLVQAVAASATYLEEEVLAAVQPASTAKTGNFGAGTGITWPDAVVAPFVDITGWVSGDSGINGALNLQKVSLDTGIKHFNLGFIQGIAVEQNRINWGFGGFTPLSEQNNDGWQYEGIKTSIRKLRESGGDVAISFGGLHTGAFWELTQDVNILANTYSEIVNGFGLTRLDLDIEGSDPMDYNRNVANAKAIKRVQDQTGVDVVLTLPVMDFGLTLKGEDVVRAYLEQGVELKAINLMTMCYGSSVKDYAQGSLDAVDNTKTQLQSLYKNYANITLNDKQAYALLGTTPSIGFEGTGHPYFDTSMTQKLVDHANERGIGQVSFWSMNRDSMVDGGVGQVRNKYEHSRIIMGFGSTDPVDPDPTPSTPASQPTSSTPSSSSTSSKPTSSTATSKPTSSITTSKPTSSTATSKPTSSVTTSKPTTSTATSKPTSYPSTSYPSTSYPSTSTPSTSTPSTSTPSTSYPSTSTPSNSPGTPPEDGVRIFKLGTISNPISYEKGEPIQHNGHRYVVYQTHKNFGDPNWAPGGAHSLFLLVK